MPRATSLPRRPAPRPREPGLAGLGGERPVSAGSGRSRCATARARGPWGRCWGRCGSARRGRGRGRRRSPPAGAVGAAGRKAARGGHGASAAERVRFPFRAFPAVQSVVDVVDADADWRTNDVLSVSSASPGRFMHAGTPSRVTNSPAWPATVPLLQTVCERAAARPTETISTTSVCGPAPMEPAIPQPSRPPVRPVPARVGNRERLREGGQRRPRVEDVPGDEVHGDADVLLAVGQLGLAPEGVAAGGQQAVDRAADDERDRHRDHQLDEAEAASVLRVLIGRPPCCSSREVPRRVRGFITARPGSRPSPDRSWCTRGSS